MSTVVQLTAHVNHDVSKPGEKSTRLLSLDALRGFDMFWIISGEGIFHGLYAATNTEPFKTISTQLHHSPWNGFTFYDLIFPLFIFIAGVSMPFSFGKQLEKEKTGQSSKKNIYRALIIRTLVLLLLGMIVNGLLQWKGYYNTRFASVLGRIALSCFFAALIYLNTSLKKQVMVFILLLTGYFAAMMLIPVPGHGAGVLTPEGNLSAYVDRLLLPGKLHRHVYDPEGLLSTIPAIGSAMLGIFTGQFLRSASQSLHSSKKAIALFIAGLILIAAGLLWSTVFPLNKTMWTSSFVLYAGGWSLLFFSLFYWIIDVKRYKTWSMPMVWIGTNSILIYMAAHGIVNFESTSQFLFGGFINATPEIWHPAVMWMGVAIIQLSLLYFLYRKKWFLRI